MDEIVKAALRKWPNVPACRGWLALDARGDWYMRDDRTQAAGPFPQSRGSRVVHDKLREFIGRNYECDEQGAWYFQNGPQRVYVELAHTPWVWRLHDDGKVTSHTNRASQVEQAYVDEQGCVYLKTSLGFGLVHTQDVYIAAAQIEAGNWSLQELVQAEIPARFGFVKSPQQMQGAKKPA